MIAGMMSLNPTADKISRWAATQPHILRVFLYGSRVRGRTKTGWAVHEDSDLDVAVQIRFVPNPGRPATWSSNRGQWLAELQQLAPFPVHLEKYDPRVASQAARAVEECSWLIYEKKGCPSWRPRSPAALVNCRRSPFPICPDFSPAERHLALTDRHLAKGKKRIVRQAELVAGLRPGVTRGLAERVLATMEQTLVIMHDHRRLILTEIAQEQANSR
jgi:predicted nucleotidyltransferase